VTAHVTPPREWVPVPKGRPGPRRSTATPITLWAGGMLLLPSAACDALGDFERVHLLVSTDRPGYLWLVPAADDDDEAYRLSKSTAGYSRRLTATDLPERLGVDPDQDIVRGDWMIEAFDQIVVRFPVLEGQES
jgi:hypothetical protein